MFKKRLTKCLKNNAYCRHADLNTAFSLPGGIIPSKTAKPTESNARPAEQTKLHRFLQYLEKEVVVDACFKALFVVAPELRQIPSAQLLPYFAVTAID